MPGGFEAEFDLIDSIYAAMEDESLLPPLLESVACVLDARAANLNVVSSDLPAANLAVVHGIPPKASEEYSAYFWSRDEWYLGSLRCGMAPGVAYRGTAFVDDARLRRSEFFADHLAKLDLFHWCGACVSRGRSGQVVASVQRSPRQPPFTDEEVARFGRLLPHFARAIALRRQLMVARRHADALLTVAGRDPVGVLLVDGAARIFAANESAEAILSAGDGLCVDRDGVLRASRATDERRLRASIAASSDRSGGDASLAGVAIPVPRPSGLRMLLVTVMPVGERPVAGLDSRVPCVAVVVVDPERRSSPTAPWLQAWFGLTPSESRLAARLGRGERLATAAAALGLTVASARQYLKRVFLKTGCRRQSELVALLARLPSRR